MNVMPRKVNWSWQHWMQQEACYLKQVDSLTFFHTLHWNLLTWLSKEVLFLRKDVVVFRVLFWFKDDMLLSGVWRGFCISCIPNDFITFECRWPFSRFSDGSADQHVVKMDSWIDSSLPVISKKYGIAWNTFSADVS